MDPLTIAAGIVAITGLAAAWHMRRRACRAEAEIASLRGALHAQQAAGAGTLPNQRPWRLSSTRPAGPRTTWRRDRGPHDDIDVEAHDRARPTGRRRPTNSPAPRPSVDPTSPNEAGGQ